MHTRGLFIGSRLLRALGGKISWQLASTGRV